MPIYEYECPKCGRFEVVQKFSDKPLKCDPECKHKDCPKTAQRVMSASAFHLKGTGWYKTDYASTTPASAKNKGTKPEVKSESDSGSETKKDTAGTDKPSGGGGKCGPGCGCH